LDEEEDAEDEQEEEGARVSSERWSHGEPNKTPADLSVGKKKKRG
jgi:hypothetical protein